MDLQFLWGGNRDFPDREANVYSQDDAKSSSQPTLCLLMRTLATSCPPSILFLPLEPSARNSKVDLQQDGTRAQSTPRTDGPASGISPLYECLKSNKQQLCRIGLGQNDREEHRDSTPAMAQPFNQQNGLTAMEGDQPGMESRLPLLLVLHDFEARSPDEISLAKGEIVELLIDDAEYGDGWYTVCGFFVSTWFLSRFLFALFPPVFPFASSSQSLSSSRSKRVAVEKVSRKEACRLPLCSLLCSWLQRRRGKPLLISIFPVIGSLYEYWSKWSFPTR